MLTMKQKQETDYGYELVDSDKKAIPSEDTEVRLFYRDENQKKVYYRTVIVDGHLNRIYGKPKFG